MLRLIMLVLIIYIQFIHASLYADDVQNEVDIEKQALESAYEYVDKADGQIPNLSLYLELYMNATFELSQLTSGVAHITDESMIYSDIQRLYRISNELSTLLDNQSVQFKFQSVGGLSKIQSFYQEMVYRFLVMSPYLPRLLQDHYNKTSYYINYISKLSKKIQGDVDEMASIKGQLNQGAVNALPFSPQTPEQLSFALENQLSSSVINMFQMGRESTDLDMPFSSIATPPNTDLFNQNIGSGFPNVPSPNASPLQMMNYMPMF